MENTRECELAAGRMLRVGLFSLLIASAHASGGEVAPAPRIEYGDCATVVDGPVCLLGGERHLRLWVEVDPGIPVEISDDARRYPTDDAVEIQGGRRFDLTVSAGAKALRVRVGRSDDARAWKLKLDTEETPEYLARARALKRSGKLDDASTTLRAVLAEPDIERRGSVLGLLGRIALEQDDREVARDTLERAVEDNLAQGRRLEALQDATVLSFLFLHKFRDFVRARAVLDRFGDGWGGVAEASYFLAYFRGLIGLTSDDARAALPNLAAATDQALRMGWARHALDAEQQMAVQLQLVGRRDAAQELLSRWNGERLDDMSPCEHANALTNLGWSALLILEAGEPANDPTPVLSDAMAIFEQSCQPNDRVNGLLNLALAHLHAGRIDEAAAALERAQRETNEPELRMVLWAIDIEARIALARDRPDEAIAAYDRLDSIASATLSPNAAWRAAVGKAAALEALGNREAALAAYAAADARLEDAVYQVPLDQGREKLLASRTSATRRYLALLLDDGKATEAFELARRTRSRMLSSLRPVVDSRGLSDDALRRWDSAARAYQKLWAELASAARMSWTLSEDQLRAMRARREGKERLLRERLDEALHAMEPNRQAVAFRPLETGELLVTFQPLAQGWVTFVYDGVDVRAQRSDCEGDRARPAALASCLLAPFADALRHAHVVRVLPVGMLNRVDFQTLPLDGDVLLAAVPIVYGLDLTPLPEKARATHRALVVADPTGNLSAARQEARIVEERLSASGTWTLDVLQGSAADSASVLTRLEDLDLFHFSGHARYGGSSGWRSALQLAGDTSLDVADILALSAAPRFVVLSGCETAVSSSDVDQPSIGLAQAFAANGAAGVVASTRPVDDATTRQLVTDFYGEWLQGVSAAQALRFAQLALRRSRAEADWSAFRLIER